MPFLLLCLATAGQFITELFRRVLRRANLVSFRTVRRCPIIRPARLSLARELLPFGYASVNPRLTKYSLRVQLLVWADFLCTVKNTHSHFLVEVDMI